VVPVLGYGHACGGEQAGDSGDDRRHLEHASPSPRMRAVIFLSVSFAGARGRLLRSSPGWLAATGLGIAFRGDQPGGGGHLVVKTRTPGLLVG
jgi:hypothetical protein